MSRDSDNDQRREACHAEALAWRVRLTEDPAQATQGLEDWLARDPAHADAWHEVQDLWGLFGEHATAPEAIAARRAALGRAHRQHRRRWTGRGLPGKAIAASVVFVAVLAGVLFWQHGQPDVYRTVLGERRVVTLADGSTVSLDAASEVRVAYSERARELTLVRGQARFDVAHDPRRPFAVQARDQRVVATGTAFNVDLFGPQVLITLIEGHVQVQDATSSPAVPKAEPAALRRGQGQVAAPQLPVELSRGQRLVAAPQRPLQVQQVDVDRITAWQQGQLVFDNEPLTVVAARVSRYTAEPVTVADDSVATLRLSGVFNAGDLSSFLTTVTAYLPVQSVRTRDGRIELRGRPDTMQ